MRFGGRVLCHNQPVSDSLQKADRLIPVVVLEPR
jgi:hypothetical protein